MFRLNRNERSHWSGNGVHVESELVFMIGRNMHAVGQPGGWTLLVRYGLAERALAAQRSKQIRVFRKLDTLVLYLQQIGVSRFEVDAASFSAIPRQ